MHKVDHPLLYYLRHLNLNKTYKIRKNSCELCERKSSRTIREIIDIGAGCFGYFPVVSCNFCGFIYQKFRFEKNFYNDYYKWFYRKMVCKQVRPHRSFIKDQISRGKILLNNIKHLLADRGNLLDVGCSSGGMMKAFMQIGWKCMGTDPDQGFVKFGKKFLKIPIQEVAAEKMNLKSNHYDLIIIMGSLEHVFDPNKVLSLCRKASKPNGLLLLEGRGNPQNESKKYFNHNHHRYLSLVSMKLFMKKHGWNPILATSKLLTGPTRKGGIYCLGRASKKLPKKRFQAWLKKQPKESSSKILYKFNSLDKKEKL